MTTKIFALAVGLLLLITPLRAEETKRLKAAMYVGGGFHDYKMMPWELAKNISAIANVAIDVKPVTVEEMAAAFADPKFGDGYDIILYSICFGEKWKDGDYDGALRVAKEGKPAVVIHCTCHTYRAPRDVNAPTYAERIAIADAKWHAFLGMDTRVHDKYQPFTTEKVAKDHPILKHFPDNWKTPGDEMYNTVKMMPTATPLLNATSPSSGKVHTVAWVNQFGRGKIFGTTLGHDMKTGADPDYHKLLAYGLLWAAGRLDDKGEVLPGNATAK